MNIRTRRLTVAATACMIALGGLSAASAATTEQAVRQSDFITALSDTRANGTVDFLKEGLRVRTGPNTAASGPANNKAAEYFDIGAAFPTSASLDWTGTTAGSFTPNGSSSSYSVAQPGMQLVFSTTGSAGSGDGYNVLVGEQVYSTNQPGEELTDWWLTNGSGAIAKGLCPSTAGGSGSGCHGSLADWKAALPEATTVYAGGFSLGSGIQGAGLLRSETFGDTTYTFTDEAADLATADTTGSATKTVEGRKVTVNLKASDVPEGSSEGAPALFEIRQGPLGEDGTVRYSAEMGAGGEGLWSMTFPAGTAKKRIQVYVNGERVLGFQAP